MVKQQQPQKIKSNQQEGGGLGPCQWAWEAGASCGIQKEEVGLEVIVHRKGGSLAAWQPKLSVTIRTWALKDYMESSPAVAGNAIQYTAIGYCKGRAEKWRISHRSLPGYL